MKEEALEIVAASLDEARSQLKAKVPPGCFVLSETVLSDGRSVTVRESAETAEAARLAARGKVPSGFRIDSEIETRRPDTRTIRVAAEGEEPARSQAQSQLDKGSVIKKITLAAQGKKGFLGIGKTPNQYDVEILRTAEVEVRCKSDARLSITFCRAEEPIKVEAGEFVTKALDIIGQQVVIGPVFSVRDTGGGGLVMEGAKLLGQAAAVDAENAALRYAYVSALRLAMQFKTAEEENARLIAARPEFSLARFSLESWTSGGVISPSPFAYPEWTTASGRLPEFYRDKLRTFTVFPAREGIYPRAALFEKDNEGWWTRDKRRDVKAEVAVVLAPGNPNVAAIYRRCTGPGLTKADMQEALVVLDVPKDDLSLVGWEYLVDALFTDVVVVDRADNVVLSQRVPLSKESRATLAQVRSILLETKGRKMSNQEMLSGLQRYQAMADLEEIERKYFRR